LFSGPVPPQVALVTVPAVMADRVPVRVLMPALSTVTDPEPAGTCSKCTGVVPVAVADEEERARESITPPRLQKSVGGFEVLVKIEQPARGLFTELLSQSDKRLPYLGLAKGFFGQAQECRGHGQKEARPTLHLFNGQFGLLDFQEAFGFLIEAGH
jgi:hypothetical protein